MDATDVRAIVTQALVAFGNASSEATTASLVALGVAHVGDARGDLELTLAAQQAGRKLAQAGQLVHEAQAALEAHLTASALSTGRLDRGRP